MPSIRFIEPSFTRRNPSTNGLVDVVVELVKHDWDVEVFSHDVDPSIAGIVHHRLAPHFSFRYGLSAWCYFLYYQWQGIIDKLTKRKKADVTVSTGFMFLAADLATVHFSHIDYLKSSLKNGQCAKGFLVNLPYMLVGVISEIIFLWNPFRSRLLVVSKSVVNDMCNYAAPWKSIQELPNQVNAVKFTPAYRETVRPDARQIYGFNDEETVFLFGSAGHHYRKGLFQAVEVIAMLRSKNLSVQFLIIGGNDKNLNRLLKYLKLHNPDFESWIKFSGFVTNPEFHFSAADALFLPSLSEAFSLVEIEAAALGLPLYLTAHHGSEMILKDGENGRLLPWDTEGMAEILESEIRNSRIQCTSGSTGYALSKEAYFQAWMKEITTIVEIV